MNKLEQLQSEGEDRFKGREEERGGEEGSSPFALGKKEKSAPTPISVMVIIMCICCTCDNI